jgi:hypothetical protein
MEEEYELNQEKLKEVHSRLLTAKNVSEVQIGTVDEFLNFVGNDTEKLIRIRHNLIKDGFFTSNQLGGSDSLFVSSFKVKKKDGTQTSSEDFATLERLGEEPSTPIQTDRPSKGEFKLTDWNTIASPAKITEPATINAINIANP